LFYNILSFDAATLEDIAVLVYPNAPVAAQQIGPESSEYNL
jgi:hypothetical protein